MPPALCKLFRINCNGSDRSGLEFAAGLRWLLLMKTLKFGRLVAAFAVALSVSHAEVHAQTQPQLTKPAIRIPASIKPAATVRPRTATPETYQGTPAPGTDADGDGAVDVRAGGTDCDDSNASRYPGATEVANKVDEDCNDTTLGVNGDQDGDGWIGMDYCNGTRCGADCNDQVFTVHPKAEELPNRIDDNCDGIVDNLRGSWWSPP